MGSLWLSGRASERGIQRSEVRFLMGTRNFFLCPTLVTRRKKHLSLFHYRAKNLTSLLFLSISNHITPLKQKKKDQNSPPSRRNTFVHLICVANCDTEHSFEPQLILYLTWSRWLKFCTVFQWILQEQWRKEFEAHVDDRCLKTQSRTVIKGHQCVLCGFIYRLKRIWDYILIFNPLRLNINMHVLYTLLHAFLKVLLRRIYLTIRSFFSWWSFPLFLIP